MEGLPRPTREKSGHPSRRSPQFFVDTPAGLFGRGHHRGSRRVLVLQDPLDGPMRGRRGRHCPTLRRSTQCRCLASGPGKKGLGASRDSPGNRRARLGLKQPHLLSQRPLPASLSQHNDPDALASGRRRATGDAPGPLVLYPRPAERNRPSAPAPERRRRQSQAGPSSRDI